MKNNLKLLLILLIAIAVGCGAMYMDYKIWRLQHPDAPTWTWIFSKG